MEKITDILFAHQDTGYRDFQAKLMPTVKHENIIGVRTPELRKIAKEIKCEDFCRAFFKELPHRYFDENQLHAFVISAMDDFDECVRETDKFLPYVDNWSTCDQLNPAIFKKHTDELIPHIRRWLGSNQTFTIRFGINTLTYNYLGEHFRPEYVDWVAEKDSDEYYVKMGIAWFMSFALIKQWDTAVKTIESKKLSKSTQNKSIQKSIESFRLTKEQKDYLRTFKK